MITLKDVAKEVGLSEKAKMVWDIEVPFSHELSRNAGASIKNLLA